jgi:hypothetical protein
MAGKYSGLAASCTITGGEPSEALAPLGGWRYLRSGECSVFFFRQPDPAGARHADRKRLANAFIGPSIEKRFDGVAEWPGIGAERVNDFETLTLGI